MARIFLIGATGGVGHRLHPLLTAAGHQVTGLHREPDQADALRAAGVTPCAGDLMSLEADDFAERLVDHDLVVFSAGAAGSGLPRTSRIDGEAPLHVIEAMRKVGLARILLVSAFPEAGRAKGLGDGFEHYMKVKKEADAALTATELDWVILRPGTLKDEPGDGRVAAGWALPYGDVARDDVAAFLAALVDSSIRRAIIELTDQARGRKIA